MERRRNSVNHMSDDFTMPEYTLYFDTNTAYSKKPSEPISGKLVSAIALARKHTSVEVRVPEVVFEELIHQQFKIADAALENLRKNARTLKDVCGHKENAALDSDDLITGIREQFEAAGRQSAITILATPVAQIDWTALIQDSCWRRPPFEKPKSEDDLAEKGFRDKIILETILHDAKNLKTGVIAFISGDNLHRTTFAKQINASCKAEAYSGFDEFVGHLDLLQKTKSNRFAKTVLSRASAAFFTSGDPNCVANSQGVLKYLNETYCEELSQPSILQVGFPKFPQTASNFSTFTPPLAGTNMYGTNWLDELKLWTPVTSLSAHASPPVFQPGLDNNRYHWRSTITLVRLLRRNSPQSRQYYLPPEERIRTKDVDVRWSCTVDPKTATFTDYKVEAYEPQFHDSFVEADWKTRSAYGLPLFPGLEESEE